MGKHGTTHGFRHGSELYVETGFLTCEPRTGILSRYLYTSFDRQIVLIQGDYSMNSKAWVPLCGGVAGLAFMGCLALSGCDGGNDTIEISETRTVEAPQGALPAASTAERFGFQSNSGMGQTSSQLVHNKPEAWQDLPATDLRSPNFAVGPNGEAECYVTVLSGTGGGAFANANRWRAQMGLEPMTEAEFASLPTVSMLHQDAPMLELTGTFQGMSGDANAAESKLFGVIADDGGNAVFVKMVGPAEVLDAEKDAFIAFCESVDHASHGQAQADPHAGMQQMMPGDMGATAATNFTWEAPEGWTQAGAKPMREVTFVMGEEAETEVYIAVLSGMAGGVEANINRWCSQMDQDPLSAEQIAALPTVSVLGSPAPMVEVVGSFTGMSGPKNENYMLLGAISELPAQTVFIKMTGPKEMVEQEREHFVAFCESLSLNPNV